MKPQDIHKILFITLSNIGDVILTLPVLSALKDNFPDAKIDVVVAPRPKDIFEKAPRINEIFIYDKHAGFKDKIRFIKGLRQRKYDLAVDMRGSLFPFLIGAKNKIGLFQKPDKGIRHKRMVHLAKLKPLGIVYREQKNIYIDESYKEKIDKLLRENGVDSKDILIGISPVSRSPLKAWQKHGFVEVITALLQEGRYKVILMGDINEDSLVREISDPIQDKSLIDLTGKTSLNELCALIERLRLVLTCDSAVLHIASDLDVRVVAIFGPTDPEEYGPRSDRAIVIRRDIECSPCKKAVCRFNHECMSEISSEEVLGAVRRLV